MSERIPWHFDWWRNFKNLRLQRILRYLEYWRGGHTRSCQMPYMPGLWYQRRLGPHVRRVQPSYGPLGAPGLPENRLRNTPLPWSGVNSAFTPHIRWRRS